MNNDPEHNADPGYADFESRRPLQFSLASMLKLSTTVCVTLVLVTIPLVQWTLGVVIPWVVIGILIIGLLVLVQLPGYFILRQVMIEYERELEREMRRREFKQREDRE